MKCPVYPLPNLATALSYTLCESPDSESDRLRASKSHVNSQGPHFHLSGQQ